MLALMKLNKIITVKLREKDTAAQDVVLANLRYAKYEEKLEQLLLKQNQLQDYMNGKLQEGILIGDLVRNRQFMSELTKQIKHSQHLLEQANKTLSDKQNKLLEANIEVKKFEKLREKSITHTRYVIQDNESKALDEIAGLKYGR